MGRAGKSKSKGRQSFAKGVGSVVETAKNVRQQMVDFRKEWAEKFNHLNQRFDRIMPSIAQQFAALQMNGQIVSNCVDAIDLQQQAMMKIDANIYSKLALYEAIIEEHVLGGISIEEVELDIEGIKIKAMDNYVAIARQSVELAKEERDAAIKAQEEDKKKAQEEALKAQQAKEEAERAEEALRQAQDEDSAVVGDPGGPGVSIPEGAEVFGG